MSGDLATAFNALPPEAQQELLNGPGLPPPSDIIPNFENPPNQNATAHASLIICILACVVFVPLAVYAKVVRTKIVSLEDGFAAIAFVSWCVFVGFLYDAVRVYGYFIHQWDFPLREVINYLRYFYVATLTYFVTIAFIKLAIVFQWMRLFVPRPTRNAFWWTCQIIGWLNFVGCMTMMFLVAFGCKPIAKFYNPLLLGTCVDTLPTIYIAPSINLVFDIVALILPQKVIWSLHLSLKKRLGISVLFALGILACLSAALRIPASVKFAREEDNTYNIAPTELWCLAEMSAGLLIYSVPSAPAGVKRVKDVAVTSSQRVRGASLGQTHNTPKSSSTGRSTGYRSLPGPGPYRETDQIPLTTVPPASKVLAFKTHEGGNGYLNGTEQGITRMTHITMTSTSSDMK